MEILDRYDVEAVHFDDYFYADLGTGGNTWGEITILTEPDQKTYEDYIDTHTDCKYQKDNAWHKASWRRYQIDLLIILIKDKIKEYNKKNKKYVQFGISPSGVYKNGDGIVSYDENGTAITTGSNTTSYQQHYSSYLFCDTLKWCNEGWIDYIIPQSYWARNHPRSPYNRVMDWWDKVLKYKKVNLFSGIGLYQSDEKEDRYSWQTDEEELYKNLKDVSNLYNYTDGACIFNFVCLRNYDYGRTKWYSYYQVKNGLKAWTKRVPLPEIKSFDKIELNPPDNIKFENKTLKFDSIKDAKFYVIYRNKEEIKFTIDEIIDIIGNPEKNSIIEWKEEESSDEIYNYKIRTLSYSNTLGFTSKQTSNSKMNFISIKTLLYLLAFLF